MDLGVRVLLAEPPTLRCPVERCNFRYLHVLPGDGLPERSGNHCWRRMSDKFGKKEIQPVTVPFPGW